MIANDRDGATSGRWDGRQLGYLRQIPGVPGRTKFYRDLTGEVARLFNNDRSGRGRRQVRYGINPQTDKVMPREQAIARKAELSNDRQ